MIQRIGRFRGIPASIARQGYEALVKQGKFSRALRLLKKELSRAPNNPELWLSYGHLARLLSLFEEAGEAYERVLFLAPSDPDLELSAELGRAATLRAQGKLARAEALLWELKAWLRTLPGHSAYPHWYWNMGMLRRHQGRLKEAERLFLLGKRWAGRLQDLEGKAYLYAALGGLRRVQGNFRASLRAYGKAHTLFVQLQDPFGYAYSSCGLGNALRMLGRREEARGYLLQALRMYEQQGDQGSLAYTLFSLGTLAKTERKWEEAQRHFSRARKIFERCGDRRGLAYVELSELELASLLQPSTSSFEKLLSLKGELEHYGFALEACYAELLFHLLHKEGRGLVRVKKRLQTLGTTWFAAELPLNLP